MWCVKENGSENDVNNNVKLEIIYLDKEWLTDNEHFSFIEQYFYNHKRWMAIFIRMKSWKDWNKEVKVFLQREKHRYYSLEKNLGIFNTHTQY